MEWILSNPEHFQVVDEETTVLGGARLPDDRDDVSAISTQSLSSREVRQRTRSSSSYTAKLAAVLPVSSVLKYLNIYLNIFKYIYLFIYLARVKIFIYLYFFFLFKYIFNYIFEQGWRGESIRKKY